MKTQKNLKRKSKDPKGQVMVNAPLQEYKSSLINDKAEADALNYASLRYLQLQVDDYVQEVAVHTKKVQANLVPATIPDEPHEPSMLEDYALEFSVRQQATDIARFVNEQALQRLEHGDRISLEANLQALQGRLIAMAAEHDKAEELIHKLFKAVKYVNEHFHREEVKSEGTQTVSENLVEVDSSRFKEAELKRLERFANLRDDANYGLSLLDENLEMRLNKHRNSSELKIKVKSDIPFMKNDTIYDAYTKSNILSCEGTVDNATKMLENTKFVDTPTESNLIVLNSNYQLLPTKNEISAQETPSFNSMASIHSLSKRSLKLLSPRGYLSKRQTLALNAKNHIQLPPVMHSTLPTVKLEFETLGSRFSSAFVSSDGKSLLRKLELYQLRNPEFTAAKFSILDLFQDNRERELVKELLKVYSVLEKHKSFIRQLFSGYNLNYQQNVLKLEFRLDCLHLEKIARMNYIVFAKICSGINVDLEEYQVMRCFYISSRPIKVLPTEDRDWLRLQLLDVKTCDQYYLTLPGFIEALIRVSVILKDEAKALSLRLKEFLEELSSKDLLWMEGFVLGRELGVRKTEEVFAHHLNELAELYGKNVLFDCDKVEESQCPWLGKVSLADFIALLRKNYILDHVVHALMMKSHELITEETKQNPRRQRSKVDDWDYCNCLGKKVFGNPLDLAERVSELKMGIPEAVGYFLSCIEDTSALISGAEKHNPIDYVIGLPEFMKLLGVLAVSVWLRQKDMATCNLSLAVDKFLTKVIAKEGITVKPYFN